MSQLTQIVDDANSIMSSQDSIMEGLTQYVQHEFSHGRSRGFFEPGGVEGPVAVKRQRLSFTDMMSSYGGASNSTYPKKKMAKKLIKRKSKQSLSDKIRKISIRQHEIKNWNNGTSAAFTHSTQQSFNMTAGVVQGTTNGTRNGDEITLNSVRAQVLITAPTTAGAYSYRVMFFYSGEEFSSTSFSTVGLAFAETFLPGAVVGTNVAGIVNRKAISLLFDTVVNINSNLAATQDVVHFPVNIKLGNVKFPYQSAAGIYGKFKNLYCVVTPYVAGGTTGVTTCGNVAINYSLDYRDA